MTDHSATSPGSPLSPAVALLLARLQERVETVPGWLSEQENAQHLYLVLVRPGVWRGLSPAVQFLMVSAEQIAEPDPLLHFLAAAGQPVTLADDWPNDVTSEAGYAVTHRWLNPNRPIGLFPTYRAAIQQIHAQAHQL
ncbi:hypothetical protein GO986_20720 [Deinococcus sp. HMF7620]|uniref:Uncharacterized protein n=1 Tax=Deinococcus arboris TaxID=2682977 RepID=A0A7C9MBI7_9DEIO|nr:hypothetical protein [Deinococcus arboris]MVN89163.1 hypothetical protein [Deinococcus arboris]